jgi:hypothetical protein
VSTQNQVKTEEAEEALRLNEKLRAFFKSSESATILSYTYKTKTICRLVLDIVFFCVAFFYLFKGVFDFDFECDLTPYLDVESSHSLPTAKFWCVNLTATFSRMLVIAFLVVIIINIIVCVVALFGWGSILKHLPNILDDSIADEDLARSKQIHSATFSADSEKVGLFSMKVGDFAKTNDVIFLLYLLRQTNVMRFAEVLDFASADYHHELLEYLSHRTWPLEKLKALVKPPPASPALKIIDSNLVLVPPAVRHLPNLVEIDFSSNNNLFDLGNLAGQKSLKYLKLRGCNIKSMDALVALKTLLYVDVSNNKINSIPADIIEMVNLHYLLIKLNRITILPRDLLLLPALR